MPERPQRIRRGRDADRAVGTGPNDQQFGPSEEEGREGAEAFTDEDVDPAAPGKRRGQLRIGECAAQSDHGADHPRCEEQGNVVDLARDRGRGAEDAAADGRARSAPQRRSTGRGGAGDVRPIGLQVESLDGLESTEYRVPSTRVPRVPRRDQELPKGETRAPRP